MPLRPSTAQIRSGRLRPEALRDIVARSYHAATGT
jgi:hypothetical protein